VATEKQFEISVRRLTVNLWSVRKQDGKFVVWDSGRCVLYIVGPVVMGIIDAGDVDTLLINGNYFRFIQQHPYPHFFQAREHTDRVVIAQHGIYCILKSGAHESHEFEGFFKGAECFPPIVAREDTDVILDLLEKLNQPPHWVWIHICVQVTEM
jgi:hypothetical protein